MSVVDNKKEKIDIAQRFRRTNTLVRRKLREYLPVMIVTNMSVFLLTTVDGLVAGNMVGEDALAAVSVFSPAAITICVISTLVSAGTGTSLSVCLGKMDMDQIRHTKSAIRLITVLATILTALIELPLILVIMNSYDMTPEIKAMAWQYAIGQMIAMPISVISSVGSYQLTILGKMRVLMVFSLGEGLINLMMDLFFAGGLHMGVAGIGFGTACANAFRVIATVIYMFRKTDLLRSGRAKIRKNDIKDILYCGLPDGASALMVAVQNYVMMKIILLGFGDDGGVIKGVCFLAFNISSLMTMGVQGSMRPMAGLFSGSGDTKAMRSLMRQCVKVSLIMNGCLILFMEFFPSLVYRLNGVKDIPDGGVKSLRFYLLYFLFYGMDALFRLYFSNRKDTKYVTMVTIVGNATLPVFALLLYRFAEAPFIWRSFLMMESLIFSMNVIRYSRWKKKDLEGLELSGHTLYLTVRPDEAIEASRMIREFADERGCSGRISYRTALCMEEMVAYTVASLKSQEIQIQIMVWLSKDEGQFGMIDDGRCIALDENEETHELVTDNYELIRKMSKSIEYQYILNMNYTVIRF